MSMTVALEELASTLVSYPWGFLVTVGDDQRARSLAVPTVFADGVFSAAAGAGTRANAAARPGVTIVFPPASGHEYSLIVDGVARVEGDTVLVEATAAVLHRPALRDWARRDWARRDWARRDWARRAPDRGVSGRASPRRTRRPLHPTGARAGA